MVSVYDTAKLLSRMAVLSTYQGIQGIYLNVIKAMYSKPTAQIKHMEKNSKYFHSKQEWDKFSAFSLLSSTVFEVLARAI